MRITPAQSHFVRKSRNKKAHNSRRKQRWFDTARNCPQMVRLCQNKSGREIPVSLPLFIYTPLIPSTCRAVARFFLSSLSFGFGAISPDSPGASPAYSTNSPVSPVRPAARNVPFSPSCTVTPSRPGTTTIFCPSSSSSSSHSHFFPAARAHFIVLSPHQRP